MLDGIRCFAALLGLAGWLTWGATASLMAQEEVTVESLIQVDPVFYLSTDGLEQHREAFEQTAAYKAFYESGMVDAVFKLVDQFGEEGQLAKEVGQHLLDHGASIAVNLPEPGQLPIPRVTVVLPEAAGYHDQLKSLVIQFLEQEELPVVQEEIEIEGRTVFKLIAPKPPLVEAALWSEGNHLVLAVGIGAAHATIKVAEGKVGDITNSRCWKEYIVPAAAENPMVSRCWLDFAQIRTNYGQIPIPAPDEKGFITVNQFLEIIGLHEFGAAIMFSSLAGEETVRSFVIEVPSPSQGVMTFWDPAPLELDQEFTLPPNLIMFGANSMEWSRIYAAGWKIADGMVSHLNPAELQEFRELKAHVPEIIGFDPQELLGCLGGGTYVCLSASPGIFSIPNAWIRQKVEDEEKLKQMLAMLAERIEPLLIEAEGVVSIRQSVINDKEVMTFSLAGAFTPSLVVSDGWLMISSSTQGLKSYWLREQGKLPTYEPEPRTAARLKNLPEGTISYGITDPTFSYQQLLSVIPMYIGIGQQALIKEGVLPPDVPLPDFPPVELVTQHIKPSFTVVWRDEEKLYAETYSTVPEVSLGVASGSIMVALLLPAVQQAREAARRVQLRQEMQEGYDLENGPLERREKELDRPEPRPRPGKPRPLPLPAPEQ
ncbi:hypothetical protein Pla110_45610 [Polystyrenella longa]|uniref:DUF3352 domain-containing protein n=1 Tax=Polystyrenella longa TaxID=2528007 RepID=A0A518CUB7_9PLAN|nr:hypothetical protein [Polystyrenella longa]QDU82798.1 hypothetical protein Pla110_45610 [Polystyrenella longa]